MTDEEKLVIENLKTDKRYSELLTIYNDNIDIILNLIEKQEKVIDEMTKELDLAYNNENKYYLNFEKNICKKLINSQSEEDDCYLDIYDEKSCLDCIKEYFYRKVEK